jgi:hypothetical protein
MCGKLQFKLHRNTVKCFDLLSRAQEINERKNSSVSANTQKQLRVFILYQMSAITAHLVIWDHRQQRQGLEGDRDDYLSDEIISVLEKHSYTRDQPSISTASSSTGTGAVMGRSTAEASEGGSSDSIDDGDVVTMTCDDVDPTVTAAMDIYRDGDSNVSENTPHDISVPLSSSRALRLWQILNSAISGLIECRRVDPYHSLSVHKISVLLRQMTLLGMQPPLGMQTASLLVEAKSPSHTAPRDTATAVVTATAAAAAAAAAAAVTAMESSSAAGSAAAQPLSTLQSADPPGDTDPTNGTAPPCPPSDLVDLSKAGAGAGAQQRLEISVQSAFNESAKLFDKKRLQIVALWCLETAANGCDRILQRTYKFDTLRRKMIIQYFELAALCDNYSAIVTVLNWTLGGISKLNTATLKWIIRTAVKCCVEILEGKYSILKSVQVSQSVTAASCAAHAAASSSSNLAGVSSGDSTSIVFHPSATTSAGDETLDRAVPIGNSATGTGLGAGGVLGPEHAAVSMDVCASTSTFASASTAACNASSTNVSVNHSSSSSSSDPTAGHGSDVNNCSDSAPDDQALSLNLLKRAYDLYSLVSKVLDPSEVKELERVVTQISSLVVFSPVHTMSRTAGGEKNKGDTGVNNGSTGNSSNSRVETAAVTSRSGSPTRIFQSVLLRCNHMWSAKAVAGAKRARNMQTVPGSQAVQPLQTSSVVQTNNIAQGNNVEQGSSVVQGSTPAKVTECGLERPTKMHRPDDDASQVRGSAVI